MAGAGSAGQPVWPDGEQERHDWRPRSGAGNRCAPTVGYFAAPAASPFLCGQKGAKKPLRTCGSKNSLCPDVYWESCSSGGAGSSERRWTLQLPPSPRFSALDWWVDGVFLCQQKPSRMALAWRVDGGLAGLASRRGLLGRRAACCRSPTCPRTPRAERSDRTSHPQLLPGAGATASASSQVRTAQQNSNPSQGQRPPDLEAIIIGGRQAEFCYTPS